MRSYHKNPRQITKQAIADLERNMDELGDISGIIHNQRTDEAIGGNQRNEVLKGGKVTILEQYANPLVDGTLAIGYIEWRDHKFNYRLVDWDDETCEKANLLANKQAGQWDGDILANQWNAGKISGWMGEDFAANLGHDFGVWENLTKSERVETEPEFKEYDESIADGMSVCECPMCGHKHAKKD